MHPSIIIKEIDASSKFLEEVIQLADENSSTLGFLPRQAFYDHASKKMILVAIDNDSQLLGYLLYRIVRRENKATIVHLCVDEAYRGTGVSKSLFRELKDKTSAYRGISLLCRRDYTAASKLWEKLGFHARSEKPGRGKEKTTLTEWWFPFGSLTLFDIAASHKQQVVIDANIFFEFQNDKNASPETLALTADWLYDEIELKITPELFNEINRQENERVRQGNQSAASQYLQSTDSNNRLQSVVQTLNSILSTKKLPNDLSDIKQVAWAVVDSNVSFFVTRDQDILDKAEPIYSEFGLLVLRPVDLILHIDEYVRIGEYNDMRFSGTQLTLRRVHSQEGKELAKNFQYDDVGEKQTDFLEKVRPYFVNIEDHDCYVVEDRDGNLLILFVYNRSVLDELRIPVFRVNRNLIDKKLIRHLLLKFLMISSKEKRDFTRITEPRLHEVVKQSLQEDSYFPSGETWIKASLPIIAEAETIADYLEEKLESRSDIIPYYRMHIQNLRDHNALANVKTMSEIERVLWPVKISNAAINTISISIDPDWANRWFDSDLASQTLFGAQEERAFNREGVYYSRRPLKAIDLPARILWYVKKDERLLGTEAIRACSRLDDIIVGPANDIFRQFQHLGIYEWKNILNLVGNNPQAEITAYRFSDTQLFDNAVPYAEWEKLTKSLNGKQPNRQSPASVPQEIFLKIYTSGTAT